MLAEWRRGGERGLAVDAHITAWRQWTMARRAVALARKTTDLDHEPYVNGGGAAFTGTDVASVIGNSLAEAIDYAMETMVDEDELRGYGPRGRRRWYLA